MFASRFRLPGSRLSSAATVAVVLAVGACSSDSTGPTDNDPMAAVNFQRLLIADASAPSGRLIALHNDSTVQTFTFSEVVNRLYSTHSGRLGVLHLRTANQVQFIDGGVWTEGNQGFRRGASTLGFQLSDGLPTHENVVGDWVSVFFDGSGVARWVRESALIAGQGAVAFQAVSGTAHHGGSFTVLNNSVPFFAHSAPNPAGAPTGVAVRNAQGQVVAEVAVGDCPGLHGNGSIATGGVFGCNNGMVLVRPNGASVSAEKVTLGGDMAGLALRNAYTGHGGSFILGQFAAFAGQPAQRVFATINPTTGAVNRLSALPGGVTDHWRTAEPVKGQIVMLGTNGTVYVFNGGTGQLQHTIASVVPALPASGALVHTVAVAEDLAAVASPTTSEVVLLNLATGAVIRRIPVSGAPSRLALLGASRTGQYTAAP